MPRAGWRPPIPTGHLCCGYETAQEGASISYAAIRIFSPNSPQYELTGESKMAHYLTNDDKYRDLIYGDDDRSYLRSNSPGDYRFGRPQGKRFRVHARSALRRVNGTLRTMVEAIANAKLRRMERELELAAGIQRQILPRDLPVVAGLEIAAKNRPKRRLSRSFSRRASQVSALLPRRANTPASSAEIDAFPARNSRPV